jgi:hypothetical protein
VGRADSPLLGRLIFLVGARRSGTNWVERILTAHPAVVAMPSETYIFSDGIKPLSERFQHGNPGSHLVGKTFIERDAFLDIARDLVDRAFLDTTERTVPKVGYVLERTPWHAYDLDLIADVCPDARVVHVIRDGRDVARSLLAMDWGPTTMAAAAEEWRSSVSAGCRGAALFGDAYAEVRYERLMADPRAGVSALLSAVGLELRDELLDQILLEARSEFNVDPGSSGAQADKWRSELSRRELRTFDRVAGAELERIGYAREGAGRAAAALGAVEASARTARTALGRWRHPRGELRRVRDRNVARWTLQTLEGHYYVAERFHDAITRARSKAVLELLEPTTRISVMDSGASWSGRGGDAAQRLVAVLAEHDALQPRTLTGSIHSSPGSFTIVDSYELNDGSAWARTLVLTLIGLRITGVAVHRFPLAGAGAAGTDRDLARATHD